MRSVIRLAGVVTGGMVLMLVPAVGEASQRPAVYFLADSGRTLVSVTAGTAPLAPSAAVATLAAGPTAAQRAAGYKSAFPSRTRPAGVNVAGAVATVVVAGSALRDLGTIPRLRVIASVTYTLTSFPRITTVRFSYNSHPWGVYDHSGRVIRDYRRGTLTHPWLTACAPGNGCFSP
jgi:spore germination protein GerM